MTTKTKLNKINIFALKDIVQLGMEFDLEGKKLSGLFVNDSDLKFSKNELNIHESDIGRYGTDGKKITIFVDASDDTKYHRQWYKLKEFGRFVNISSWELFKEDIEYKS